MTPLENRILILAPGGRDAALACAVLREVGLEAEPCRDAGAMIEALAGGAGALLVTEEAAEAEAVALLERALRTQPSWSDLPVVVLSSADPAGAAGHALVDRVAPLGNVSILERPMLRSTLLSAVRAALRSRAHQYRVRDLLAEHERGLRTRDEFLAMLGHELRNPLAAITNAMHATTLAEERGSPDAPALRARERDLVSRQVRHLARLVDDLLDVSRVTSGKVVLRREALDLGDLVLRCADALHQAAQAQRVDLRVSASRGEMVVEGDPTRLDQVMTNLLTNAIKYTPPGGRIDVDALRTDGGAVVRVSDTGAGLAPEMTERVFDLFTQAKRTLDRTQGGLGIGLTLVRALVRLHGGEVTARSEGLGRGATFELILPLSAAGPSAGAAPRPARNVPAGSRRCRVLVVEDNVDNREGMVLLLRQLGHDTDEARDGEEALARLGDTTPDLALVDIGLPGVDGYEVARRARRTFGRAVYLVALTGYGQSEDKSQAREAGFDAHLTKPVDLETLNAVLARAGRVSAVS